MLENNSVSLLCGVGAIVLGLVVAWSVHFYTWNLKVKKIEKKQDETVYVVCITIGPALIGGGHMVAFGMCPADTIFDTEIKTGNIIRAELEKEGNKSRGM